MSTTRAAGIVSVIALISKLTGFIREMVIAHGYGASIATVAYGVAQSVPNLFLLRQELHYLQFSYLSFHKTLRKVEKIRLLYLLDG